MGAQPPGVTSLQIRRSSIWALYLALKQVSDVAKKISSRLFTDAAKAHEMKGTKDTVILQYSIEVAINIIVMGIISFIVNRQWLSCPVTPLSAIK